ncbi:MAG TPA: YdcF family protein [Oscillatoriaceae cyanobacterium M7585_C2015_266]|nr:YdcF family protein [Oscillatoriaceae cyanobacterium M7585_C2015_266]
MLSVRRQKKILILLLCTALIVPLAWIPVRISVTRFLVPEPQAIFVLGGDIKRMRFAAEFWHSLPSNLEIWISDEDSSLKDNQRIFKMAGVPENKVHYDLCPTDTVTNFTCIADKFAAWKIWHLYLITSEYHMARSRAIATLVFGSRGIIVTPVTVPSKVNPPESLKRIVRDCFRSIIWIMTGRTGASFNPRLQSRN